MPLLILFLGYQPQYTFWFAGNAGFKTARVNAGRMGSQLPTKECALLQYFIKGNGTQRCALQ